MHHAKDRHHHAFGIVAGGKTVQGILQLAKGRILQADVSAVDRAGKGHGEAAFIVLQIDQGALAVRDDHVSPVFAQVRIPHEGIHIEAAHRVLLRLLLADGALGNGYAQAVLLQGDGHLIEDAKLRIVHIRREAIGQKRDRLFMGRGDQVCPGVFGDIAFNVFQHDARLVEPFPQVVVLHLVRVYHGGKHSVPRFCVFHDKAQVLLAKVQLPAAVFGHHFVSLGDGGSSLRQCRGLGRGNSANQQQRQQKRCKTGHRFTCVQSGTPPLHRSLGQSQ